MNTFAIAFCIGLFVVLALGLLEILKFLLSWNYLDDIAYDYGIGRKMFESDNSLRERIKEIEDSYRAERMENIMGKLKSRATSWRDL